MHAARGPDHPVRRVPDATEASQETRGTVMRTMESTSRWTRVAGLTAGMAALAVTLACNSTPGVSGVSAQDLTPAPGASPVVVGCEPHQRALVRQTVVNGASVSQIECVAAAAPAAYSPAPAAPAAAYAPAAPSAYAPVAAPPRAVRPVAPPVYSDIPDAEVVPVRTSPSRTVRTSQVVYEERPVKRTRSAAKSAIIIGSSAGAGAGVGAAVGGKKGALIGAAIGGGGAAVWDQVTRRK